MTPKVPTSDTGTATPGMAVAQRLWRKAKITRTTRTMEITRVISTSRTEARMVMVRSCALREFDRRRNRGAQQRQHGFHAIHRVNDVGRRLAEKVQLDHRLSIDQSRVEDIHLAIHHGGHIGQTNRRAFVVGNDQRPIFLGAKKLVIGIQENRVSCDPTQHPWANGHWSR